MNAADIAQSLIEQHESDAIKAHRARQPTVEESRTHCELCDDPIPQRRREILPGVRCCVECAD